MLRTSILVLFTLRLTSFFVICDDFFTLKSIEFSNAGFSSFVFSVFISNGTLWLVFVVNLFSLFNPDF